jgi:hypothetical protein
VVDPPEKLNLPKLACVDSEQLAALQRLLGRDVRSDEENCADFAELTESNLNDVARLARSGARLYSILYLRFLIGQKASLRNAMTFVDRVVVNGVGTQDWLDNYRHQD